MNIADFFTAYYEPHIQGNLKPRTVKEYRRLFYARIDAPLGRIDLRDLTYAEVDQWHLAERTRSLTQANRALAVVSGLMTLAVRYGEADVNPASGVKQAKEEARERYLDKADLARLLGELDKERLGHRVFVRLCLLTGARPGELQSATWGQIVDDSTLELPDSKTGRRTVYLSPDAWDQLLLWRADSKGDPSGLIFPGLKYRAVWDRIRKNAGLNGVRLYDLRHTFASVAIGAGVTLEEVSQLLGHSSPVTTRRYARLMPEAGKKAASITGAAIQELVK